MRKLALLAALAGALLVSGCNDQKTAEAAPPPQQMTASAIGRYCGMNVLEHPGPKGQIILASQKDAIWFSSARDAISFTMLPEEPELHEADAYLPAIAVPMDAHDWSLSRWQAEHKPRALVSEAAEAARLRQRLIAVRPN